MYFDENLPQGSKRDRKSGALLFPVHPRELEAYRKREEIDNELEEIKKLKEELIELKKSFTERAD